MRYLIGTIFITLAIFLAAFLAVSNLPDEETSTNSSDGEVLWRDDAVPIYYKEWPFK